ncbi:MAG TPA: lmo0937 family membrane protein [Bryobacteraceae bacterium]|nr:lmo0937 family membrane protein [Bryobacteraceae bacterium]
MRLIADFIFIVLFIVLLIGWLLAWAAFHVAGGLVHLLLVFAVIALIVHFVRGGRRAA